MDRRQEFVNVIYVSLQVTSADWPEVHKLLRRIGHDTVPFFSVDLHDCLQNEMCQCRGLRAAGEFPNRLMWRCAGVTVDEHDMISVGGEQNFTIVLLQGYCITVLYPPYPNVWFAFHLLHSTKHTTLGSTLILAGNRERPVGTAAKPRNGKPWYCRSILGRRKWFLSSPKVSRSAPLSTQPLLPPTCLHRVRAAYFVCSSVPFSNQSRAPPYVKFTKKHFVVTYSISIWYSTWGTLNCHTTLFSAKCTVL